MPRSRSSFEIDSAVATATSLRTNRRQGGTHYAGVDLVSFAKPAAAAKQPTDAQPSPLAQSSPPAARSDISPLAGPSDPPPAGEPSPHEALSGATNDAIAPTQASPPKLPDLTAVVSPVVRCEKIVAWIADATGATDVFLADAAGLPIAGAVADAEVRLAGSGVVASSIASLAAALPTGGSQLFEMHIGEGPFFQLIGFAAGTAVYVVGLSRGTPLTPRQAHAIRLACRHALGETLGGRS